MRRIAFWLRWSARDLRGRWLLVAAIAATIAMGTGAYAALESMSVSRQDANTRSLALARAHDVRVYLADGSFAAPSQLEALVDAIPHRGSVTGTEVRLVFAARVDASTAGRTILVPGRVVGMTGGSASVDALHTEEGRAFTPADEGRPVAQLEYHFAAYYDLAAPGSITVGDGRALGVVGNAFSSDYFMVISPLGDIMAEANFAVVFTTLATAGELVGHPGAVNELVLTLSDPTLAATVRDELQAAAAAQLPSLGASATVGDDEDSRRMVVQDAYGDQEFFTAFSLLMLAGATFAAFNLTTRIVESQRRQVGIGLALGLPPRVLAIRPLAVAAEIALLGIVLGLAAALALGDVLRGLMESIMPMPVFDWPLRLDIFARAAAFGFLLPFVASIYPVWRAVRARPVDAIRTGYLAARRPGLVRLATHLPLPPFARQPVRNVLRTPRRTLLTALGIGAAVTVLIGTLGMLDTMSAGIDRGEAEIRGDSGDRIAVDLAAPLPGEAVAAELASVPGAGRVDLGLRLVASATTADGRGPIDLQLDVLDLRDNAWRPSVARGSVPSGPGEIMLAQQAVDDLGLALGGTLSVTHPVLISSSEVAMVSSAVKVVGIHGSPLRPTAYMDVSGASLFGMAGLANRATVVPAAGADQAEVQRALFRMPGVVSAQPIDVVIHTFRDLLSMFTDILGVVALVALALALLVAYNSATITQDERTREIATMLAFGLPMRRVLGSAVVESGLIGLFGTVLGLAGGALALFWIAYDLFPGTAPDFGLDPAVGAGTLALTIVVGLVAVALAPLLTWRRLSRLDLPATLRVVE